jgi:ribosome-binding protein aMBF1 (putative translation factor)
MSIADDIRAEIARRGWSIADLARAVRNDIPERTVYRIVRGRASDDALITVLRALELDIHIEGES